MKKVMYMHTGSANHGCEALVRTTAQLLGGPEDVILWSMAKNEDVYYGSAKKVEQVLESEEIKRGTIAYFEALIKRRILIIPLYFIFNFNTIRMILWKFIIMFFTI